MPDADHASGFLGAFAGAIHNEPLALTLHALVGTLLIAAAIALLVRALRARRNLWSALAGAGLLAVLFAWIVGVRFVSMAGSTGAPVRPTYPPIP